MELESIAKGFSEVVTDTKIIKLPSGEPLKLRIYILDKSFLDVWISISGKYSYHWKEDILMEKSIAMTMHHIKLGCR